MTSNIYISTNTYINNKKPVKTFVKKVEL